MSWQTLSSKQVYQNRYMTITEDELVTPHGDKVIYGIVRKEPFSVAIAWDGAKVLLVGQYRVSANVYSWEFPMGHAESDNPLVAAKRELQEETGLVAEDATEIATYYPALGTMNQKGYIYLVTKWTIGEQELDKSEKGMKMKWVTIQELNQMLIEGKIVDAPTIAALKFFELHFSQKIVLPCFET